MDHAPLSGTRNYTIWVAAWNCRRRRGHSPQPACLKSECDHGGKHVAF